MRLHGLFDLISQAACWPAGSRWAGFSLLFANCGKKCTDPPPLPLPASLRFIVAKVFGGDYAIEALEPANKSKCHSQDSAGCCKCHMQQQEQQHWRQQQCAGAQYSEHVNVGLR